VSKDPETSELAVAAEVARNHKRRIALDIYKAMRSAFLSARRTLKEYIRLGQLVADARASGLDEEEIYRSLAAVGENLYTAIFNPRTLRRVEKFSGRVESLFGDRAKLSAWLERGEIHPSSWFAIASVAKNGDARPGTTQIFDVEDDDPQCSDEDEDSAPAVCLFCGSPAHYSLHLCDEHYSRLVLRHLDGEGAK